MCFGQERTKRGHGILKHQHLAAIVLHDCVGCLQCRAQGALHLHAIDKHSHGHYRHCYTPLILSGATGSHTKEVTFLQLQE